MIVRIMDRVQAAVARARPRHGGSYPRVLAALRRIAGMLALHGRPLPARLAVVLLPVTLVATTLGLLRVADTRAEGRPLADAERYVEVSRAAVAASNALEDERDLAARAVAGGRERLDLDGAFAASDQELNRLEAAVDQVGDPSLAFARGELRSRLRGLDELRIEGFGPDLPATTTVSRYGAIVLNVIQLGRAADGLAVRHGGIAGDTAGVFDLLVAAGLNSQRRALGTALLTRGSAERGERATLGGFTVLVDVQTETFRSVASAGTLALFQAAGVEAAASDVDLLAQRIAAGSTEIAARDWIDLTTLYLAKVRQVIQTVVDRGADQIAALRAAYAEDLRRDVAVVLVVLFGTVLAAGLVGYGLIADLRRLRNRMRHIAEERLPRAVAAIGAGSPPEHPDDAPAPPDEIGDLTRAFEVVQDEAIRLASAEAMLRVTMAGVSRTVTQRTEDLVARQLELITDLEQRQVEPATLERLFQLDHLSTRIRRHSDNLLVLAGAGPGWRWPRPAMLQDVVQAATAAIEQYRRVEVAQLPAVAVAAPVVVDMIQILTELIDNAAKFSPPDRPVRVTAGPLSDGGYRIEVRDAGDGLGSRRAAALNARLSRPALDDLGDEPTLGLYVVSALAARAGIGVHLIPIERGCVAAVAVPGRLLTASAAPADLRQREPLLAAAREARP
ncbi:nitrate- and nitrite sensing domain-containing protein [Paractinoplanes rishiriensis]|uniref:histidine kinase n=1 Tax=Paractinoplanes rishiriensis TaxID=1050105 RepID=A0A919JT48_9ACTN|nr:nitrate- and nitrite sensing domain-containing protein [Actinoplanes rishiriensis]GIE94335.1 hypothetical protein Ari01nite_18000 [Actinoplanes rishiriensis]